ncbi:MAG: hypothetical protein VZR00_05705 [Lachnospiraceae bacterium]|jgi:hypothetical protein|nr:hypothetical protein [Lachnospiraceae bacterium]MEE3461373.1 hypothetical protein [Lachnospiraceae bacterium]
MLTEVQQEAILRRTLNEMLKIPEGKKLSTIHKLLSPGQAIILAGLVGSAYAAGLVRERYEELSCVFPEELIKDALGYGLEDTMSPYYTGNHSGNGNPYMHGSCAASGNKVQQDPGDMDKQVSSMIKEINGHSSAFTAAFPLGEGGLKSALYYLSEISGRGFYVDMMKVPLSQAAVEIMDHYSEDIFSADSAGSALFISREPFILLEELKSYRYNGVIIGSLSDDNDKKLKFRDEEQYLSRPAVPYAGSPAFNC